MQGLAQACQASAAAGNSGMSVSSAEQPLYAVSYAPAPAYASSPFYPPLPPPPPPPPPPPTLAATSATATSSPAFKPVPSRPHSGPLDYGLLYRSLLSRGTKKAAAGGGMYWNGGGGGFGAPIGMPLGGCAPPGLPPPHYVKRPFPAP